jgi:hypothetical protein
MLNIFRANATIVATTLTVNIKDTVFGYEEHKLGQRTFRTGIPMDSL